MSINIEYIDKIIIINQCNNCNKCNIKYNNRDSLISELSIKNKNKSFTNSYFKLNNEKLNNLQILKKLYLYNKNSLKNIIDNTTLNIKKSNYNKKGFVFIDDLNISIQYPNNYRLIKEIINLLILYPNLFIKLEIIEKKNKKVLFNQMIQ